MAKKIASIETIKKRIKKALEKQGSYNEGIDILIETTALSLHALYEISAKRQENPTPTLTEISREGHPKLVANPIYKMQNDQIEMIRKQLRELRLTLATEEGSNSDELSDLIDEVNNVE